MNTERSNGMKICFKSLSRDAFFWMGLFFLFVYGMGLIDVATRSASDFESRINHCGTLVKFEVTHSTGRNGAKTTNSLAHVLLNDNQLVKEFHVDYWADTHNEINANIGAPICISGLPINSPASNYYIFQITLNDKNLISPPLALERYLLPWGTYFDVLLCFSGLVIILWRCRKLNRNHRRGIATKKL